MVKLRKSLKLYCGSQTHALWEGVHMTVGKIPNALSVIFEHPNGSVSNFRALDLCSRSVFYRQVFDKIPSNKLPKSGLKITDGVVCNLPGS